MHQGFACEVLAYDLQERPELMRLGIRYTSPRELAAESDIITLHCPLTPQTRHVVNRETLARTKRGFMLINTSRGTLVDAEALIDGLKSGQIGAAALDVYEQEADFFFEDLSARSSRTMCCSACSPSPTSSSRATKPSSPATRLPASPTRRLAASPPLTAGSLW